MLKKFDIKYACSLSHYTSVVLKLLYYEHGLFSCNGMKVTICNPSVGNDFRVHELQIVKLGTQIFHG